MNPVCIIAAVALVGLALVEYVFSPRIDVTKEGDVLLWYNVGKDCRHYKHLFKIK